MIIYIHGFGGSGEGSKAQAFREYFKSIDEPFIAPSLSYVPKLAIRTLEELILSYHGDVKLIGSSLGGYYTIYLAQKYALQSVLINPSINPDVTLQRALGEAPNFFDESSYSWKESHIDMLKHFRVENPTQYQTMLLVQKGDELLDYSEAVEYLCEAKTIEEEGGNHSFEGIERHFERIRAFFAVGDHFKHTMRPKGVTLQNDQLAVRLGDMYYDALGDLLHALSKKLDEDAKADEARGRKRLADNLYNASECIEKSALYVERAWGNCEVHTMQWLEEYGSNRER